MLLGYANLNSVPCRSMACMMMARRRASAIRAFRISVFGDCDFSP
jgi:hypothetical protein